MGRRTSVAGDGKRAIGAEPDTRTPVRATGIMQTTPAYTHTINSITGSNTLTYIYTHKQGSHMHNFTVYSQLNIKDSVHR